MEPVRKELMEDALKFYQKFLQRNNGRPADSPETAVLTAGWPTFIAGSGEC